MSALKSVSEHNEKYFSSHPQSGGIALGAGAQPAQYFHLTGFACSKCGAPSYNPYPNSINLGTVPSITAKCTKCGHGEHIYG